MINKITHLKNIGRFEDASFPKRKGFGPVSLIHGGNGKGKTTVAAVLRSLAKNKPSFVLERSRLGSTGHPEIIIEHTNGESVFNGKEWNNTIQEIKIFDDTFVSENVCSGNKVDSSQRQRYRELIIGEEGVKLAQQVDALDKKVETQEKKLRKIGDTILPSSLGTYSIKQYCNLQSDLKIDKKIENCELRLKAARFKDEILAKPLISLSDLPELNVDEIRETLLKSISEMDTIAAKRVMEHISTLDKDGEAWLSDGMKHIDKVTKQTKKDICPLCTQGILDLQIIAHYRVYFSQAYTDLKSTCDILEKEFSICFGDSAREKFLEECKSTLQLYEFWKKYAELPAVEIDINSIDRMWTGAYQSILNLIQDKVKNPIEPIELNSTVLNSIKSYTAVIQKIQETKMFLENGNVEIRKRKDKVISDDVFLMEKQLGNLKAKKDRYSSKMSKICDDYLKNLADLNDMKRERDKVLADLKLYRDVIFPEYVSLINKYLEDFSASFKINNFTSKGSRGGTTMTYDVDINNTSVSVTSAKGASFSNTLSAGDRSNLALAFFLASLDKDSELDKQIVVFDDPMTSLDNHRSNRTQQTIVSLSSKVEQTIVLSHSIQFLCELHREFDSKKVEPTLFYLLREKFSSKFSAQKIEFLCASDYDKSHKLIRKYSEEENTEKQAEVAKALRIMLESYLRVACVEHFPHRKMLGPFLTDCKNVSDGKPSILSKSKIATLEKLVKYANKFHHDTNPKVDFSLIDDAELCRYVDDTLKFTSLD